MAENGYIIRCPQCRHYQICFAGIVLSLCEKDFEQLLREIDGIHLQDYDGLPADARTIIIATPKQGVHLWLSVRELEQLKQLAETADCEMKTLDLMALFHE